MEYDCDICGRLGDSKGAAKYCEVCGKLLQNLLYQFMKSLTPMAKTMIIDFMRQENKKQTSAEQASNTERNK